MKLREKFWRKLEKLAQRKATLLTRKRISKLSTQAREEFCQLGLQKIRRDIAEYSLKRGEYAS